MEGPLDKSSFPTRIRIGIFVVALLIRLFFVSRYPTAPVNDLLWNDAVGWNLAQGNGYTASQSEPRVPAIFRTPGYPYLLAAVYSVFGHSVSAVYVVQAVLDAFSALIIGQIAFYYFTPFVSLLTSALYALYPYPAIFCGVLHQDILLVFVTLLLLWSVSRAIRKSSSKPWFMVGVITGATALVKVNFVAMFLIPVASVLFYFRSGRLLRILIAAFGLVIVLSPWVIRNYLAFRTFPTLSAGPGMNLHLVVLELKRGEKAVHDYGMTAPRKELTGFSEGENRIEQEKNTTRQSLLEIKQEWRGFLLLNVKHIPELWITRSSRWHSSVALAANILSWIVVTFGVAGMIVCRKRWKELMPLYFAIFLITLMYTPFIVEARYTLPARPVMLCFVASALAFLWQKSFAVRRKTGQRVG